MIVFADYDNVDRLIQARGLEYLINRIISSVATLPIPPQPRVDIRFYGGWFSGSNLSRLGQALSAEIAGKFPQRITAKWHGEANPTNILANGHIVRGLAANEQVPLHHTFRKRPFSGQLYFTRPAPRSCISNNCPLDSVEHFIKNQKCPTLGCGIEQKHVLVRCEQKLVDTMLVSDLIFWASRPSHPILAVLSSDDDMWPGIRTAIAFGGPIIQIHTAQSPQHPGYVNRLTEKSYLQTNL